MENDKEKYQLVEDAINQCIETLKKVETMLDEISYNGESIFKKVDLNERWICNPPKSSTAVK